MASKTEIKKTNEILTPKKAFVKIFKLRSLERTY